LGYGEDEFPKKITGWERKGETPEALELKKGWGEIAFCYDLK